KSLRLNAAREKLQAGVSVSETAYQVGYESPSQFSREYKRQFGESPKGR
ncbi:TPA: helix-turn-helix domain-containing protein, partial [Mannheimia haemolytica]|nr:helix-turn-helix domain-containing protein [Mannheimia haemolytica]